MQYSLCSYILGSLKQGPATMAYTPNPVSCLLPWPKSGWNIATWPKFLMDCLGCSCVTTAWVDVTNISWLLKPEMLTIWSITEKACWSLVLKHSHKCQLNFLWDCYIKECITSIHLLHFPTQCAFIEHLFCARNCVWNQDTKIKHTFTVL